MKLGFTIRADETCAKVLKSRNDGLEVFSAKVGPFIVVDGSVYRPLLDILRSSRTRQYRSSRDYRIAQGVIPP